jgi:hypothetical protein
VAACASVVFFALRSVQHSVAFCVSSSVPLHVPVRMPVRPCFSGPKRFSFDPTTGQWVSTRDPSLTLLRLLSQELVSLFPTADLADLQEDLHH